MEIYLDLLDKRLIYVKEVLIKKGAKIKEFNRQDLKDIKAYDCVVLSPAFKWDGQMEKDMPCNLKIYGGQISSDSLKIFKEKNINYINFLEDENFVLDNASLTAEGVLSEIIANTNASIFSLKILILGGGRVAKSIGKIFEKLDLNFNFATINKEELNLSNFEHKAIEWANFKNDLNGFDVVINTIPVNLFEKADENKFKENAILFEISSKKCFENFDGQKLKYILCPALPSKYSPKSAGELMLNVIEKTLNI